MIYRIFLRDRYLDKELRKLITEICLKIFNTQSFIINCNARWNEAYYILGLRYIWAKVGSNFI